VPKLCNALRSLARMILFGLQANQQWDEESNSSNGIVYNTDQGSVCCFGQIQLWI